jgi:hypothetical protein
VGLCITMIISHNAGESNSQNNAQNGNIFLGNDSIQSEYT